MPNKDPKETNKDAYKVDDIKGFDIHINEFGEIISSHDMNKINDFLDENVVDKKLPNAAAYKKEAKKSKSKTEQ